MDERHDICPLWGCKLIVGKILNLYIYKYEIRCILVWILAFWIFINVSICAENIPHKRLFKISTNFNSIKIVRLKITCSGIGFSKFQKKFT